MRLKFREVEPSDIHDLYHWRNHPLVRKNCFNTKVLAFSQHRKWFEGKLKSRGTTIYIAHHGDDKVGSIRFENEPNAVQVSVMVNPELIGQGIGQKLIALGTKRFIKEKKPGKPVFAEIKPENIASNKAFQKAGYKLRHAVYAFGK